MKTRNQFLTQALIKSMLSGVFYLAMPLAAKVYGDYVGGVYPGYTILGTLILVVPNIVLIITAWAPVFDEKIRNSRNGIKPE